MLSPELSDASRSRLLRRRVGIGTTAAVAAVASCYLVAVVTGAELTVALAGTPPTEVPFGAAVFATAIAGVAAYLIALLVRRTSRPRRTFLLITLTGLALSAVPPLQAAANGSTTTWLLVMHVVAALALIPALATALPVDRRRQDSIRLQPVSHRPDQTHPSADQADPVT